MIWWGQMSRILMGNVSTCVLRLSQNKIHNLWLQAKLPCFANSQQFSQGTMPQFSQINLRWMQCSHELMKNWWRKHHTACTCTGNTKLPHRYHFHQIMVWRCEHPVKAKETGLIHKLWGNKHNSTLTQCLHYSKQGSHNKKLTGSIIACSILWPWAGGPVRLSSPEEVMTPQETIYLVVDIKSFAYDTPWGALTHTKTKAIPSLSSE